MILDTTLNMIAPKGFGIVYGYYFKDILVYVGSTKNTIGKRAGVNGKGYIYSKYACKFGEFILLHGWENLEVRVLAMPLLADLTKVEDKFIDKFDLINNGCNICHACIDEEDTDEYTTKINGRKVNVYHDDNLRGDTRVGLIHDQTMKLNLIDKNILINYYVSQTHGNSLEKHKNTLAFFDENGTHRSVIKALRAHFFGVLASKYNISQGSLAEDIYDFRREVLWANPCGRIDMKRPLVAVLRDLQAGIDPFPFKRKTKTL